MVQHLFREWESRNQSSQATLVWIPHATLAKSYNSFAANISICLMGTSIGNFCDFCQNSCKKKGGDVFEMLWAFRRKHTSQIQSPHVGFQLSTLTEKQGSAEGGNLWGI